MCLFNTRTDVILHFVSIYVTLVTSAVYLYYDPFWCIPLLRNIPHVHLHEKRENKTHWHGAEIEVIIEGNWTTHRVSSTFLEHLKQGIVL